MQYPQPRRMAATTQTTQDDRSRLALLWRAFEEAEERIGELERGSDHRLAKSRDHLAAQPPAEDVLARIEATAAKRHADLVGSIAKLEGELAGRTGAQQKLREEIASASAELARTKEQLANAQAGVEAEARRYELAQAIVRAEQQARQQAQREMELHRARMDVAQRALAKEREDARASKEAGENHMVELLVREDGLKERLDFATREIWRLESANRELEAQRAAPAPRPFLARPERLFPIEATRASLIPTVTPEEVMELRGAGVNFADPLLYADLTALSELSGIGVPRLWKLRALAEVMSLHGIGPEWAERLYRKGMRSIDDVACASAEAIEAMLWATYAEEGMTPETRTLLSRTLPSRCASVVEHAREAARLA
ncbi:MAG TPA: helix-hairpin-helix domain-containing protein [Candidatus Thermoplasmatota archaeon]|nr:helix-hairpin-helix domain-containing protein [Candidatus Thermoplasmatota archaeon]